MEQGQNDREVRIGAIRAAAPMLARTQIEISSLRIMTQDDIDKGLPGTGVAICGCTACRHVKGGS